MMKKIILLLAMSPFLLATQCDPEPCNIVVSRKNKENLITIENLQSTYNIGDIIWLNSTLDRNQDFNNPNQTIDLFSFPLDYAFGVQFYKVSIYNPEIYLCLDEDTTEITQGRLNENNGCNLFVYEKINDQLKCRVGVKLLETGNYKLSVYNISTFKNSGLDCGDKGLDINTTFSNNNLQNIIFTVQ